MSYERTMSREKDNANRMHVHRDDIMIRTFLPIQESFARFVLKFVVFRWVTIIGV